MSTPVRDEEKGRIRLASTREGKGREGGLRKWLRTRRGTAG